MRDATVQSMMQVEDNDYGALPSAARMLHNSDYQSAASEHLDPDGRKMPSSLGDSERPWNHPVCAASGGLACDSSRGGACLTAECTEGMDLRLVFPRERTSQLFAWPEASGGTASTNLKLSVSG